MCYVHEQNSPNIKNETISLASGLRKLGCTNWQELRRRSLEASMNNNFWIFSPAPSIGVCRIFVLLILEVNSIWSDRWLTIGEVVLLSLHKLLGMKMHAVTWHYTWILKDSHSSRWEILAEPEGVSLASGTVDEPRRSEDWLFRMDDLKILQRCTSTRLPFFLACIVPDLKKVTQIDRLCDQGGGLGCPLDDHTAVHRGL